MTLSVPTMPEAVDPSPYLIFHELPETILKELDFLASNRLCLPPAAVALVFVSSSVDHNCMHEMSQKSHMHSECHADIPRDLSCLYQSASSSSVEGFRFLRDRCKGRRSACLRP